MPWLGVILVVTLLIGHYRGSATQEEDAGTNSLTLAVDLDAELVSLEEVLKRRLSLARLDRAKLSREGLVVTVEPNCLVDSSRLARLLTAKCVMELVGRDAVSALRICGPEDVIALTAGADRSEVCVLLERAELLLRYIAAIVGGGASNAKVCVLVDGIEIGVTQFVGDFRGVLVEQYENCCFAVRTSEPMQRDMLAVGLSGKLPFPIAHRRGN